MEVQTVAVIGAGITGCTLACATALAGYRTILEDIVPASLRRAQAEMQAIFDEEEQRQTQIEYASTVEEAARQAELVIETVPDELESKLEMFTLLDKICRPETILVTTSSALSVTEIADITLRPQKCIGMRFAKPGILEIKQGRETSRETVAACVAMGKRVANQVRCLAELPH